MNRLPWLATTALAAVLIGLAAALWAVHDHDASTASSPPPSDSHIEGPTLADADPSTAVEMGLAAMWSWQPRTDTSPGAALTRAAPWVTGDLASAATGAPATGQAPPEWAGWRDSKDVVTALVETEPTRLDETTTVAATVTQQVLHRDGSSTLYRRLHVTVTVTETPQGWRMSSYRIDSVTGHG
ncbi:hypothetical protein ACFVH4_15755 [Nocardia ignorata]|uniref:hypothetical protein n=1 Tax=Nocardia ignorata TaxID=145285 RepID=UPI003636ECC0